MALIRVDIAGQVAVVTIMGERVGHGTPLTHGPAAEKTEAPRALSVLFKAQSLLRSRSRHLQADIAECIVGRSAQTGDGHQADNDDEGEHHGVFDGRGAFLSLEKFNEAVGNGSQHDLFPFWLGQVFQGELVNAR